MHNKRKKGKNRASHSAARGGGRNLAEFDGKVCTEGGRTGGEYAFRTDQLCEGMEVGIKGDIHVMLLLWNNHAQEEDWGFLLIGAKTCSMRIIRRKCCGMSDLSGLEARSLTSTSIATEPLWWCGTWTGLANFLHIK